MTVRQCMEMHLNTFEALDSQPHDAELSYFYRGALFAVKHIFDDLELLVPEGVLDAYKRIDD